MNLDPTNPVIQLCIEGIMNESDEDQTLSLNLFKKAWELAKAPYEQSIAAHYFARKQNSIEEKLKWDEIALEKAKLCLTQSQEFLPSFYLNIAKGYEDLNQKQKALEHYQTALSFCSVLNNDGYGSMTRKGIEAGIERTS